VRHRMQLYLNDGQYHWLKQRASKGGSIASVVRELIDAARSCVPDPVSDSLISYLLDEPPAEGLGSSSVQRLDESVYAAGARVS
jgi:hypothetical protein